MRPVKHLSHAAMIIITLGLLMIFEGLSIIIWGTDYQQFPQIAEGAPFLMNLGDNLLVLPLNDLVNMVIALSVTVALALFLKFTKLGTAIRARSQDEVGASVVGININKVDALVWGIGISLAALVAVLAAPRTYVHPQMMTNYQLYGFTAGVLGGFYNLFGAIAGGLLLGIMEKLVGYYISPDYQLSIILILIIVVLVVKPTGLFGSKFEGRV
jgi:branched-chain amino acid transport system permease protein